MGMTLAMKPVHLFILVSFFLHIGLGAVRLTTSLYGVHLQTSPALIGVLMSLYSLPGIFVGLMVGGWIDRHGPRRLLIVTSVVMFGAAMLASAWPTLAALFILSSLVGLCWSMFYVGNQHLLGNYGGPEERVPNISLGAVAFSVSTFLGPVMAGFLIDGSSHVMTFMVGALLMLVPGLMIGFNRVQLPLHVSPPPRVSVAGEGQSAARESMWGLFRMRGLRQVFIMNGVAQVATFTYMFVIPIYGAQLGFSASRIGTLMGSFAIAMVVVRGCANWLSRHYTIWQLLIVSMVISAIGLAALPFFPGFEMQLFWAFFIGLGCGLGSPLAMVLVHELAPPGRVGEAVGLRISTLYGMQAVAPVLAGAFGAVLGMKTLFWVLAVLVSCGVWSVREHWHPQPTTRS